MKNVYIKIYIFAQKHFFDILKFKIGSKNKVTKIVFGKIEGLKVLSRSKIPWSNLLNDVSLLATIVLDFFLTFRFVLFLDLDDLDLEDDWLFFDTVPPILF